MANYPLSFLVKVILFIQHITVLMVHPKCHVFVLPGAIRILERLTTFLFVLTNSFFLLN